MASKSKRTPKAKSETAVEVRAFAEEFGLVEDGGWVDELEYGWKNSPPDLQVIWSKIISLCREIRPRGGEDWLKAEDDVESTCGWPPSDFPGEEPKPPPGSPMYQETLVRAAPDDHWLAKVRSLIDSAGGEAIRSQIARLCCQAMESGIGSLNRNTPNKEILRGLIWCVIASPGSASVDALRRLATFSVEHKTAQVKTIAIALAFLSSESSAAALRMIATAAKRPSPKTRFNRYASHVELRIGIRPEDSAERFIPTFDLDADGARKIVFGGQGAAELRIEGSQTVIRYFKAAGKQITAAPSGIKRDHAQELQELRATAKGLGQLLHNQRDRIESLLLTQPSWDFTTWRERYLNHPVIGTLARRLIWLVDDSAVLFLEGRAQDVPGEVFSQAASVRVRLWHPLNRNVVEVQAWRNRLESLSVTQPFKQAHREVYLLTDAERRTSTYSNRFAGHILRQAQFRALAVARSWERPFLGGWDGGDRGKALRELPGGWGVEFWISAAGEEYGPTGALLHISTDQVRFYRGNDAEPSCLAEVPPMIFSEAMRDVDLFIDVASVGNDPTWSDGGPEARYRDYWQNYSFGDLSASAKTRKEVLQRLLPKLKITGQCSFDEKFLVVKGSLRTYKIHLGSGNIQMEPNNHYLCIVPSRDDSAKGSDKLFLPFEGDRTLSVILSKAFMLADDTKIKDPSIVSQIMSK